MNRKDIVITVIVGAVMALTIGYGFYKTGSPIVAQQIRLDQKRIGDLQSLSNEISSYYGSNGGVLPASISDIASSTGYYGASLADPATGKPYDYSAVSTSSYKLCADFSDISDLGRTFASSTEYYYGASRPVLQETGPGNYACVVYTAPAYSYPRPQPSVPRPVAPSL